MQIALIQKDHFIVHAIRDTMEMEYSVMVMCFNIF